MTRCATVDAEGDVTVSLERELVGIKTQEHPVNQPTGVTSQDTKRGVQCNPWAPAGCADSKAMSWQSAELPRYFFQVDMLTQRQMAQVCRW